MSIETNQPTICIRYWSTKILSTNHMKFRFSTLDNEIPYPFNEKNVKNKIALYQLKKSQLDFRLVILCEKTGKFINTDISCRSNPLLEGMIKRL